ncbi:MFS transporter [Streptomyces minutiscleroticus]|uniref:MFS transporter n=1 Tax=Streptomyces minutiscleroticus TaxID=68238 RepID=A0A918KM75_9ACTN|nr:MFS transporter [Streptomyces minutiscleroticus]GGX68935.1 MFS transporter [Streptomyces minutiscleroticus]
MIDNAASDVRAPAVTPVGGRRARVGFWLTAAVYTLVMLGGTLPIPLYAFWAPQMGFGPFTTTLVFAVYALGTVLALMVFASLSDRAGRRPLLSAALLAAATSTALFLVAHDVETLLAARFLCGLSTGVFTATATAALGELAGAEHTRRASTVSAVANTGGPGLGTLAAGLFAQYGADPTHLVFWCYLAGLVPAFLAVLVTPETVVPRQRPALSVRRPVLPGRRTARTEFLRAATAVLAAFAVSGLFSSLVPAFLREQLHVHTVAAVGAQVGLLFLVALVAQVAAPERWVSGRRPAPAFLAAGVAVFETGLWTRSLPLFAAGTLLAGAGIGLAFRRGIGVTQRLADPQRRADLLSTYFLFAYTGTIVPTLALGLLDQTVNQDVATLILAVTVVATTLAGALSRPTGATA